MFYIFLSHIVLFEIPPTGKCGRGKYKPPVRGMISEAPHRSGGFDGI
jgi:hypothetical protein